MDIKLVKRWGAELFWHREQHGQWELVKERVEYLGKCTNMGQMNLEGWADADHADICPPSLSFPPSLSPLSLSPPSFYNLVMIFSSLHCPTKISNSRWRTRWLDEHIVILSLCFFLALCKEQFWTYESPEVIIILFTEFRNTGQTGSLTSWLIICLLVLELILKKNFSSKGGTLCFSGKEDCAPT